jgi:NAD(P)-dependent dehydrogenase (short-subunit alcohol dehydrogenase family)
VKRLDGKVAIITGGNAGIGEAAARVFVREGAAVTITGRRKEELERVTRDLEQPGGRVLAVAGSVTDEAHARETVSHTMRRFGRLDCLVNNAGIGAFGKKLHETDDATWDQLIDVNLTGVFRFTRAAIPHMIAAGGGSIINVSSIASLVGIPYGAAYAATKGALDALTRALAAEYAEQNIRCNVVNPGLVDTPMATSLLQDKEQAAQVLGEYLLRRPGRPEEIANMLVYLASDEATWVTGATFAIDGGRTIR